MRTRPAPKVVVPETPPVTSGDILDFTARVSAVGPETATMATSMKRKMKVDTSVAGVPSPLMTPSPSGSDIATDSDHESTTSSVSSTDLPDTGRDPSSNYAADEEMEEVNGNGRPYRRSAVAKDKIGGMLFNSGDLVQTFFVESPTSGSESETDEFPPRSLLAAVAPPPKIPTIRSKSKRSELNGVSPLLKTSTTTARDSIKQFPELKTIQKTSTYQYNSRGNPLVIRNVIIFAILHLCAVWGVYLIYARKLFLLNILIYMYGNFGGLGITAGAHRLWAHRSYKARLPLRIFLMLCNCIAGQNDLHEWVRDHRVHHKYTETDADPHNSHRGYFFSHIGWLMTRKHPDVIRKGRGLDMSDMEADPVVMFQKRYYLFLYFLMNFLLPSSLAHYALGVSWGWSILTAVFARYAISLHCTWFVNSAAHMWGDQPYDERINPRENPWVSFGALGEGFHNYHHAFPFDYKTSEMGWKLNLSTIFIDFMALLGQAYDLKTLHPDYIERRKARVAEVKRSRYAALDPSEFEPQTHT